MFTSAGPSALARASGQGHGGRHGTGPWCARGRSAMKAAVHTRYGPPEVVRIADVEMPTVGDHDVLVKGARDDGESDGLRVPRGRAVLRPTPLGAPQAAADDPGERVRRGRGGGGRRRHVLRGRRRRVRLQRMALRCPRRVPVDARRRLARDDAGQRDLRAGRCKHRGVALRPVDDPKAKIRAGRT